MSRQALVAPPTDLGAEATNLGCVGSTPTGAMLHQRTWHLASEAGIAEFDSPWGDATRGPAGCGRRAATSSSSVRFRGASFHSLSSWGRAPVLQTGRARFESLREYDGA